MAAVSACGLTLADWTFTECAVAVPVPATGTVAVTAGRMAAFTGGLAARVPAQAAATMA